MELVYIFFESKEIRIPLFGYDKRLFSLLLSLGGGAWDKPRQEFIFRQDFDPLRFKRINSYLPYVLVDENSDAQPKVFGFFERPWSEPAQNYAARFDPELKSKETFPKTEFFPKSLVFPKSVVFPKTKVLENPQPIFDIQPKRPDKFSEPWQKALETELRAQKYSQRTLKVYLLFNRMLCRICDKSPDEMQADDIKKFLAFIEKDKSYSASSMNLVISALKFFYQRVMKSSIIDELKRPDEDENLPVVLAKSEVLKMFECEKNVKHRLLLMLAYSSGLRVSELVVLKKEHIDFERAVIHVRLGKGRKDRITVLSEKAASLLAKYFDFYDIQSWLFPGQNPKKPLTIRTAQKIFEKAVQNAKISKKVTIHSLRHAFATHLLEGGTDIRYIQTLLGHSCLRTTSRYTHVAKRNILNIKSPLDSFF